MTQVLRRYAPGPLLFDRVRATNPHQSRPFGRNVAFATCWEVKLVAADTGKSAARMRIGEVPTVGNIIKIISNGRDALELNVN